MGLLSDLIQAFDGNPVVAGKRMRELLHRDGACFLCEALPVLHAPVDSAGFGYLLTLLAANDLAIPLLADPGEFSLAEATALARRLLLVDATFAAGLVKVIESAESDQRPPRLPPRAARLFEIVSHTVDQRHALTLLPLLHHPDEHVRSRVALLVGHATHSSGWASDQLGSTDARVRANVVESLWGVKTDDCRELFHFAARDTNNRVAGNALVGLYLCGAAESIRLLARMAHAEAPAFRGTAAWAMGKIQDARFTDMLNLMLSDPAPAVRRNAMRALAAIRRLGEPTERLRVVVRRRTADNPAKAFDVWVNDFSRNPVPDLPATAFTCRAGDDFVFEYDVTAQMRAGGQYLLQCPGTTHADLHVHVRSGAAAGSDVTSC